MTAERHRDLPKDELLRSLGFGGDPAFYDTALREAGLSRPEKRAISSAKRDDVERVLRGRFMPVCTRGDCRAAAEPLAEGRTIAPAASPDACEICGGSANSAAIDRMVEACRAAGWTHLCIVGGSPATRKDVRRALAGRLEVTFVEGTASRTARQARDDTARADRVVLWGGTELAHKVSTLYTGPKVIQMAKRGVAALAEAVSESARRA
ncbi:MAG: hypothetical protein KIS87_10155 [Phycisphaeraceae bacterium]|nr:hypothetical protein [Phycisphaeraceae bacterium]